jgi:hypothetical protein
VIWSRPSLKNSLFAIADPHFLEWVGRLAFFFLDRKLERKQKQTQVSVYVPVWYISLSA